MMTSSDSAREILDDLMKRQREWEREHPLRSWLLRSWYSVQIPVSEWWNWHIHRRRTELELIEATRMSVRGDYGALLREARDWLIDLHHDTDDWCDDDWCDRDCRVLELIDEISGALRKEN